MTIKYSEFRQEGNLPVVTFCRIILKKVFTSLTGGFLSTIQKFKICTEIRFHEFRELTVF